jgi:hypothetical protein
MKHFLLFLCLFIVSNTVYSQTCCTPQQACNLRSITVSNGQATSLQLRHVGPASFQPTAGQQVNWILGTTVNPNLTNVTTTALNGDFTFNLTTLGITTSDVIVVTCIITNTNGDVCTISNQNIVWTLLNQALQIFLWRTTSPPVNGLFSQAPLPVEWISFDGKSIQGDTHLSWATASEMNNEGYTVQFSTENNSWETIGFVNGKGNTSDFSHYNFVHQNAPKEKLYYKLIQVDYDGRIDESKIISLDNSMKGKDIEDFGIYPNPSIGTSTIDFGQVPTGSFDLNIYNSIGQLIESKNYTDFDKSIMSLNLPESGLYFVQIYQDGHGQTKRFIVE